MRRWPGEASSARSRLDVARRVRRSARHFQGRSLRSRRDPPRDQNHCLRAAHSRTLTTFGSSAGSARRRAAVGPSRPLSGALRELPRRVASDAHATAKPRWRRLCAVARASVCDLGEPGPARCWPAGGSCAAACSEVSASIAAFLRAFFKHETSSVLGSHPPKCPTASEVNS